MDTFVSILAILVSSDGNVEHLSNGCVKPTSRGETASLEIPAIGVIVLGTWIRGYEHPQDALEAKELVAFLTWAETEGKKMARELNFAPLPENVQSKVLAQIRLISSGG